MTGLLSRSLHVGFARLPAVGGRRLRTRLLADEPVMVAVPAGHALTGRDSVALADLACEDLAVIARTQEPELHDSYMVACAAAGFRPRVAHEVGRTHVAVGQVACGLGLCFVLSSAEVTAYPGIAYRPLAAPAPRPTFGALWNRTWSPCCCATSFPWSPGKASATR